MNKERLRGIEERVLVDKVYYKYLDKTKGCWGKIYTLSEEDYNYLKEQAERAHELESELSEQIEIGYKFEGEIYDLEKENKRYREALEHIERIQSVDVAQQIARQALEGE